MCYTEAESLFALCVLIGCSLFLLWRSQLFDEAFGMFFLAVAYIQYIEYCIHLGTCSHEEGGQLIFITLWIQASCFSSFTHQLLKTQLSLDICFFYAICFGVSIIYAFLGDVSFTVEKGCSGHLEWHRNGGTILGYSTPVYVVGLLVPILLMLHSTKWKHLGLWFFLFVSIITTSYVHFAVAELAFASLWCYSSIVMALTAITIPWFPILS